MPPVASTVGRRAGCVPAPAVSLVRSVPALRTGSRRAGSCHTGRDLVRAGSDPSDRSTAATPCSVLAAARDLPDAASDRSRLVPSPAASLEAGHWRGCRLSTISGALPGTFSSADDGVRGEPTPGEPVPPVSAPTGGRGLTSAGQGWTRRATTRSDRPSGQSGDGDTWRDPGATTPARGARSRTRRRGRQVDRRRCEPQVAGATVGPSPVEASATAGSALAGRIVLSRATACRSSAADAAGRARPPVGSRSGDVGPAVPVCVVPGVSGAVGRSIRRSSRPPVDAVSPDRRVRVAGLSGGGPSSWPAPLGLVW